MKKFNLLLLLGFSLYAGYNDEKVVQHNDSGEFVDITIFDTDDKIKELENCLRQKESEMQVQAGIIEELQSKKIDQEAAMSMLQSVSKRQKADMKALEYKEKLQAKVIADLKSASKKQESEVKTLEAEKKALEDASKKQESEVKVLKDAKKALEGKEQAQAKVIADLKSASKKQKAELQALEDEKKALEGEKKALQGKEQAQVKVIADMQSASKKQEAELKVKALQARVTVLRNIKRVFFAILTADQCGSFYNFYRIYARTCEAKEIINIMILATKERQGVATEEEKKHIKEQKCIISYDSNFFNKIESFERSKLLHKPFYADTNWVSRFILDVKKTKDAKSTVYTNKDCLGFELWELGDLFGVHTVR